LAAAYQRLVISSRHQQGVFMFNVRGVGLINLVVTVAIASIVLLTGLPGLSRTVKLNKMASQYNQVLSLVFMARQAALSYRSFVTICPSADAKVCNRDWTSGMMVFVDHDKDKKLEDDDILIKFLPHGDGDIAITWKSFRSNNFFHFARNGWTDYYNGTFRFCFGGDDLSYNRALIISKVGRVRTSIDSDGDNVHEDREGKDITCD
jgi:type IV fimbrial biogenesis protein FimT